MSISVIRIARIFGVGLLMAMFITGCGISKNTNPPTVTTPAESTQKQERALETSKNQTHDYADSTSVANNSLPKSLTGESMISSGQLDEGLKAKADWQIIDVREPGEFTTEHVPQAINIPLESVEAQMSEISQDKNVILICRTGVRAFSAWQTLVGKGYDPLHLKVLVGGMVQWQSLGNREVTDSIWGC
ncbi:rhodanese-like domain-containing protein [Desulfosporosinus shakirovi]|uniref:rhodanese-like domain-containing protein n=1 Tax=Desulfosporosinus shakirovi TaxID=2885154 RepID=UPI001E416B19|nr:rhodanese-like domain-containing protein [Desulfosporosinus sp. SRJS8]MCB8816662.1 rhodanese-like domain-containing protein [Desulfosporosinus sp. SRJS8]